MMQQQVKVQQKMAAMQPEELLKALNQLLPTLTAEQCANYYDELMRFSDSTYEDNLKALGDIDLDDPAAINLYVATFEDKDVIEDAIADYNKDKDEMSQIQYTDYVGLMMSSVTKIICIDCVCSYFVDCFFDYDWCDYADFCTGTHQRNWDSPCNWCIKTRCFQYV